MKHFDKIIADKLSAADQHAPDASMWKRIEQALSAPTSTPVDSSATAGFIGGIAACVLFGVLFTQLPTISSIDAIQPAAMETIPLVSSTAEGTKASSTPVFEVQQRHEISLVERSETSPIGSDKSVKATTPTAQKQRIGKEEDPSTDQKQQEVTASPSPKATRPASTLETSAPELTFKAIGIQCVGEDVRFEFSGTFDKTEWLFDGVDFSTEEVAHQTFNEPGMHQVMLIAYDGDQRYSTTKEIEVYPAPEAEVVAEISNDQSCFKADARLMAEPGSNAYQWTINETELKGSNVQVPLENGRYNARLIAINQHGCVSEQVKTVEVNIAKDLFIPTAFSPDNDGTNDTWFPEGMNRAERFEVQVYELTSKRLVYRTTEDRPWNGRMNGTAEQAQRGDKFIYEVVATDRCGHTIKRKGMITAF